MISINYQPTHTEIAQVTLDFFLQRPMMRLLMYFMRGACLLLCCAFAFLLYTGHPQPKDYVFVATAIIWLFGYKYINKKLINTIVKRQNVNGLPHSFNVDKQRIFCRDQSSHHLEWKKIKFILKNANGYIIPISGITNAGRFLWFPKRGFANEQDEQSFVSLVRDLAKKIKAV